MSFCVAVLLRWLVLVCQGQMPIDWMSFSCFIMSFACVLLYGLDQIQELRRLLDTCVGSGNLMISDKTYGCTKALWTTKWKALVELFRLPTKNGSKKNLYQAVDTLFETEYAVIYWFNHRFPRAVGYNFFSLNEEELECSQKMDAKLATKLKSLLNVDDISDLSSTFA